MLSENQEIGKVWVDASCALGNNGIGRDGKTMLSRLEKLGSVQVISWPSIPFLNAKNTRKFFNMMLLLTSWSPRIPRRFTGFFYQQQVGPLRGRSNNNWEIRTHDIFPITHPEWFYWWSSRSFSKSLKFAIRQNATFRCVSEHTRRELLKIYPGSEQNVFVDACEVTPLDRKLCNTCRGCSKIKNNEEAQFIISVGTIEPRKNYKQTIRVAKCLPEIDFVLVGRKGWKSKIEIKSFGSGIKNVEWVSTCCDGALNVLYSRASLFLSTSLEEGFNLPALEARKLYNLPLILSKIPVHREIHTGFAQFFDSDYEATQLIKQFFTNRISN